MEKTKTVTKEQIDEILSKSQFKEFHRIFDKQCVVVALLPNGFTIVGESACVDPNNYDETIGYDLAVRDIEKQLWMLEGYLLQNRGENNK
ncbi:Phage protein (N4 Gp49/phage Sf6 gene 66) family protein [Tissierella praeacuta DSM 18095]|uniref:Phage protein (N4 Gp49/phage Sf6 gene 66) family protein n=1 Tax=Tissierella praeacuta DSM 18095 TaxID=1123404 RepID=A0A1M4Z6J8_9FIRM|nr:Gp49 family protein [Tissierella praeacuta]TCU67507.1 N4 Gp49/Sf6 Gp66 family protein [Tissierella praeacuta]SHF13641.1 Phage protein (N4 Gp49/phage Sf6 gene 66) family protein [Tissierella praeacuta DSM 18095]SUP00585.1 Uncharacterised protein [Tissierella praeacuta]